MMAASFHLPARISAGPMRNILSGALPCDIVVRSSFVGRPRGGKNAGESTTELVLFEEESKGQSILESFAG